MNVNPEILSALSSLTIPVSWLEYKGKATEYVVFNDSLNTADLYGDDGDIVDRVIVQIHHYTKNDPYDRLKEIRNLLREADFTILDTLTTRDTDAGTTTGYIHSIIRIQKVGMSEDFI